MLEAANKEKKSLIRDNIVVRNSVKIALNQGGLTPELKEKHLCLSTSRLETISDLQNDILKLETELRMIEGEMLSE